MRHEPVLVEEVIDGLQLRPGDNVVDCTLGDAGHAEKILDMTAPDGQLLGIDADPEGLKRAETFLAEYKDRVQLVNRNFDQLQAIVDELGLSPINGMLFDFGWSSPQFAERGRGFSFQNMEEALDMRYTPGAEQKTAADIVHTASGRELARLFSRYAEEKWAQAIADEIVFVRKKRRIETVGDLVEIILRVYREKLHSDKDVPWVGGIHPATKVFQALRIAVNDELGVIERALPQAMDVLAPGGRIAVISFHSLEDRIVKHFFKAQKNTLEIVTKKPITASDAEANKNPRARSAKLRIAVKK